jgi:hypothetical protein
MSERDEITGGLIKGMNTQIERAIMGDSYTTAIAPPEPLTFAKLKATFDYFKSESLTINGTRHEIYGFKVHQGEFVPEGVIVLTEKMKPGTADLGKLIVLFVNEGKGIIYDPAKVRDEIIPPPRFEDGFAYSMGVRMPTSPYIPQARQIVEQRWDELICGTDSFFEVFDIVDVEWLR